VDELPHPARAAFVAASVRAALGPVRQARWAHFLIVVAEDVPEALMRRRRNPQSACRTARSIRRASLRTSRESLPSTRRPGSPPAISSRL